MDAFIRFLPFLAILVVLGFFVWADASTLKAAPTAAEIAMVPGPGTVPQLTDAERRLAQFILDPSAKVYWFCDCWYTRDSRVATNDRTAAAAAWAETHPDAADRIKAEAEELRKSMAASDAARRAKDAEAMVREAPALDTFRKYRPLA